MHWLRPIGVLLAGLLLAQAATAQEEPKAAYWHTLGQPWSQYRPDTSLSGFQRYNPLDQETPWLDMGTPVGLAHPLVQETVTHRGYRTGWSQYEPFVRDREDIRLYEQPRPFTDLFYVQGVQAEQWLRAIHSRRLGTQLRLAADYSIYNANGFYANQRANIDNFNVNLAYDSKSKHYYWRGGYLSNDVSHQMNGGVDTTAIGREEVFLQSRKEFVPVQLDDAIARWNQKVGWMRHGYQWLGKTEYEKDDSVYTKTFPLLALEHEARYVRELFRYVDPLPDTAYYGELLLRTDSTTDRSVLQGVQNRVGLRLSGLRGYRGDTALYLPFVGAAYVEYDRYVWHQQGRQQYDQNLSLYARLADHPEVDQPWQLRAEGRYFITGFNGGDYWLQGDGALRLAQRFTVTAGISFVRETNSLLHTNYLSNAAFWDTSWNKQNTQQIRAGLTYVPTGTQLQVSTTLYDNFFYFNANSRPAQWDPAQGVLRVTLTQPVDVGHFHLRNQVTWQQTPADGVIRLPDWVLRHSLYYEGRWFDRAVLVQLGLDLRYHSAFRPYGFDPALGQFILSEQAPLLTYPVFDVFFNMNVQGARIFAKMEHWNHGLGFPEGYYTTYGYPAADRSFKFGISWRFYD